MIKKIKRFFQLFHFSFLPQHLFYRKLLIEKIKTSLVYFFLLMTIFSLITWINILLRVYFSGFKKNLLESLKRYPADLVIYLKKNLLFANLDRPYIFWLSQDNLLIPVVVIDTNFDYKDKLYDKIPLLVNDKGILVRWGKKVKFYPFFFKKEIKLDKQTIDSVVAFIRKYFWIILIMFLVFWSVIFTVKNLLFIFIVSFFSFVFLRLVKKRKVKFWRNYQIGLHSLTLPLIYYFLFVNIFPWWILSFRFILAYFLLVLIFYLGAFYEVYFDK